MRRFFILLLSLMSLAELFAQVTVDVKIDSLAILVGEQACVTLDVTTPSQTAVQLPALQNGAVLTGDVMVVSASPVDTVNLNEGQRVQLTQQYIITSFSPVDTLYQLPPFIVKADGKEYESTCLALKVFTIDVDTVHVDQFYGEKTYDRPELTWAELRGVCVAVACVLILLAIMAYTIYRYRHGRPIVNLALRRKKLMPPHEKALNEINRIKAERRWADEDSKEYYTMLTDALRTYMSERYGFNAMEMTSSEIIEHLLQQDDVMLDELRQLFTTADLVKFAKASTLIGENDLNLVNAITYIQQTKQELTPDALTASEPASKEEKEYTRQRLVMILIIAIGALLALAAMAWITYRLWDLLN